MKRLSFGVVSASLSISHSVVPGTDSAREFAGDGSLRLEFRPERTYVSLLENKGSRRVNAGYSKRAARQTSLGSHEYRRANLISETCRRIASPSGLFRLFSRDLNTICNGSGTLCAIHRRGSFTRFVALSIFLVSKFPGKVGVSTPLKERTR